MIEIAPPELHVKYITYDEAKLYCFVLGNGWRLPDHPERVYRKQLHDAWDSETYDDWEPYQLRSCIPVRELKDN
jgi:hypothetical protein